MPADTTETDLVVPQRRVPIPKHLSPQAQAMLAVPRPPSGSYPALDDHDGWRAQIAAGDRNILDNWLAHTPDFPGTVSEISEGDAVGYELVPDGFPDSDRRVYLDIHGGALIMGAGEVCRKMAASTASLHGVRTVSVDYRMPPDHPFPTGLDDCLAFYRALLRNHAPHEIVVGGGSAGGNLAAATMLKARDEGLPMPAGLVLISPEADLAETGDSFATNAGLDGMGSLMQANLLYAAGADLRDPYVSPLYGDFTKGFPPTLITAGTRDLFLSNAVRLHRKLRAAGNPAELHILEAAAHGAFAGSSPEEAELDADMRRFCIECWNRGG